MESGSVGTLNLYLYTGNEYANSEPIWTKSGDQGITWNSATVKISSSVHYSVWLLKIDYMTGHKLEYLQEETYCF